MDFLQQPKLQWWARRKELSRNEALKQVKDVDKFPETFLGRKLEEILYEIDILLNEFIKFVIITNKIFQTDENGNLIKDNKLGLKKLIMIIKF